MASEGGRAEVVDPPQHATRNSQYLREMFESNLLAVIFFWSVHCSLGSVVVSPDISEKRLVHACHVCMLVDCVVVRVGPGMLYYGS